MLGMRSKDLDSVELRALGPQIIQIQAMFFPLAPFFVCRVAPVYPGIVDQDDSRNLMWLVRDVV